MCKKLEVINLYKDSTVRSIRGVFSISDEDDLDQCWHHFHVGDSERVKSLEYFLSLFYEFSHNHLLKDKETFFELISEKSNLYYYLTIQDHVVSQSFASFVQNKQLDFISDEQTITIRIAYGQENNKAVADKKPIKMKPITIPTHDFICYDDLQELLILCEDMQDIMHGAKKHGFVEELYIRLRSCFSLFCLNLNSYGQLQKVITTLQEFSLLINSEKEGLLNLSADEVLLIEGFVFNIERWLKSLFIEGGVEVSFLDDSFAADLQTIKMMVSPLSQDHVEEEDLADIFDF